MQSPHVEMEMARVTAMSGANLTSVVEGAVGYLIWQVKMAEMVLKMGQDVVICPVIVKVSLCDAGRLRPSEMNNE